MHGGKHLYPHWWILHVVTINVQAESIGQTTYADCGSHPFCSLRQLGQDTVIGIIVNQDNGFFRTTNQIRHKLVGIKYLSVKENALFWRKRALDQMVDFLIY